MNQLSIISRKDAAISKFTGLFFILAAFSSIVGLKLYDPILAEPNFIEVASQRANQIVLGAINELILAVTATGTGLLMYPYLRRYHESMGMGYLIFRVLEVVFILIGIVAVLVVLSISQQYADHSVDKPNAHAMGLAFIALHDWTFMLGPNFMLAINTFLYSFTFLRTGLVPKPLASLGLTAASLIMVAALLEMFGTIEQVSVWGALLAIPIAIYELSLAIWLIMRGFRLK